MAGNDNKINSREVLMHCYRPQRSWAKVIFSQACVCPQGGSASVHAGISPPGSRPTPPLPPCGAAPPPGSRLQHTVNERPVRILLQCILVFQYIPSPACPPTNECFVESLMLLFIMIPCSPSKDLNNSFSVWRIYAYIFLWFKTNA